MWLSDHDHCNIIAGQHINIITTHGMPLFCTLLHLSTTSEIMHLSDQGHCQQSPTSALLLKCPFSFNSNVNLASHYDVPSSIVGLLQSPPHCYFSYSYSQLFPENQVSLPKGNSAHVTSLPPFLIQSRTQIFPCSMKYLQGPAPRTCLVLPPSQDPLILSGYTCTVIPETNHSSLLDGFLLCVPLPETTFPQILSPSSFGQMSFSD